METTDVRRELSCLSGMFWVLSAQHAVGELSSSAWCIVQWVINEDTGQNKIIKPFYLEMQTSIINGLPNQQVILHIA